MSIFSYMLHLVDYESTQINHSINLQDSKREFAPGHLSTTGLENGRTVDPEQRQMTAGILLDPGGWFRWWLNQPL